MASFSDQEEKLKEIKKRHIEETVKNIAQTEIGMKVLAKMDETEITELDTDKIMMKQVCDGSRWMQSRGAVAQSVVRPSKVAVSCNSTD